MADNDLFNNKQINDYVTTYDQYKHSTIEEVTLAEDIIFEDFNDYHGAKFFYRVLTPNVDDIEDEPETKIEGEFASSNFILLDIPSSVLWSMIKPQIVCVWADKESMAMMLPPFDYEEREALKAEMDPQPIELNMAVLPGNLHTCRYKVVKGTLFLVEILGGHIKIENSRIIGVSVTQKVEDGGLAIETEDEITSSEDEEEDSHVIQTSKVGKKKYH